MSEHQLELLERRATPAPGDKITVWYSCGAASTVALMMTIIQYGHMCTIRAVNNPVAEEDIDNQRFLLDVSEWLGIEIEKAINPKYPSCSAEEVWEDRGGDELSRRRPMHRRA